MHMIEPGIVIDELEKRFEMFFIAWSISEATKSNVSLGLPRYELSSRKSSIIFVKLVRAGNVISYGFDGFLPIRIWR